MADHSTEERGQLVLAQMTRAAEARDADLLFINGPMRQPADERLIEKCVSRRRRPGVLVVLTTFGGEPDVAYRLGRTLQRYYPDRVTAYVPGHCWSAGTLLLIAANEIVLSPHAELGPLDPQVLRSDEVGVRTSSLTPTDALRVLTSLSTNAFEATFTALRTNLLMTTRVAADVASNIVSELYGQMFAQVDPMRVGELDRATRIMLEYGQRLGRRSKNLKEGALMKLINGYPSHGFVIDIEEARELFVKVSEPTGDELIFDFRSPLYNNEPLVDFMLSERREVAGDTDGRPQTAGAASSQRNGEVPSDPPAADGQSAAPGSDAPRRPGGRKDRG